MHNESAHCRYSDAGDRGPSPASETNASFVQADSRLAKQWFKSIPRQFPHQHRDNRLRRLAVPQVRPAALLAFAAASTLRASETMRASP